MPRWKPIAAALWIFVSNLTLAWWVKGDLEMAWLIGLPLILAGGPVFGLFTAFVFRSWRATLVSTAVSVLWSFVLAYTALHTPHSWKRTPAGIPAAKRFASDRAALKSATENVTRYPVEPQIPARVEVTDSYITKQGFSFSLVNRPGAVRVWASFDVGPQGGIEFDVVGRGGGWQLRPRFVPNDTLTIRAAALERKFPQGRVIEAGGNGPYLPGDVLPVRIARGETDWDIALLQIADGGEPLHEIRRYSKDELMRRFGDLLTKEGLGPLESAVIYFRPVKAQDVLFFARPEFPFIGLLGNPRYWRAEITTRLAEKDLQFAITRRLMRPCPGALPAGDRR